MKEPVRTSSDTADAASGVRRRALLGAVALLVLVALAGLAAYLARDGREAGKPGTAASRPTPAAPQHQPSTPSRSSHGLPAPPRTHSPIVYAKAAAAALWSYDTRSSSQPELRAALHRWLTSEKKYADPASVDALIPSRVLWKEMASNKQHAEARVKEAHFPHAFTKALRADPGALTTAYVYAVTVSGKQSISWKGSPAGGAEGRTTTLAVQCSPSRPCALAGVLPAVSP